jgi:hypothetical protein
VVNLVGKDLLPFVRACFSFELLVSFGSLLLFLERQHRLPHSLSVAAHVHAPLIHVGHDLLAAHNVIVSHFFSHMVHLR